MINLNEFTTMKHSVSLYVPSTINSVIDNQKLTRNVDTLVLANAVKGALGRLFGGFSADTISGGWLDGDKIIEEKITRVTAFISDENFTPENILTVASIADGIRRILVQDSVLLSIDGQNYFIGWKK